MALREEEFERLQNQLLELKTSNYSLDEIVRRKDNEINGLKQKLEDVEKELSKVQNLAKLNPLAFARTFANKKDAKDKEVINQLIANSEILQRRIDTQEEEFRMTNETLRLELYNLLDQNSKLMQLARDKISPDENIIQNLLQNVNSPTDNSLSSSPNENSPSTSASPSKISTANTNSNSIINSVNDDNKSTNNTSNHPLSLQYSVMIGKENLENELNDMKQLVKQYEEERNAKAIELENASSKLAKVDELTSKINEKQSTIQQMKEHLSEMTHKHIEECNALKCDYESQLQTLKSELSTLKGVNDDLYAAKEQLNCSLAQISDLKVQLTTSNEYSSKLLEQIEEEKCKNANNVEQLTKEFESKLKQVELLCEVQVESLQSKHDEATSEVDSLKKQIDLLNQKISDALEERKIHEKKGLLLVKELKKQLASEKKRADRLQSKLQELLSDASIDSSGLSSSTLTSNGPSATDAKSILNDSSSTGSWSFMTNSRTDGFAPSSNTSAANARRPSSLHSFSDPGKESSPLPSSPSGTTANANDEIDIVSLVDDNAQLIARIAELQQEKWRLDERINHLQIHLDTIAKEVQEKSKIIEFYCMDGRSDHAAHSSTDKLTVKRVVDFIKDRGDEGQKEINRKLQRLLEETLTKNMYLQQDLESLSNELVKLKGSP